MINPKTEYRNFNQKLSSILNRSVSYSQKLKN